jgi:hypothetical protein
MAGKPGVSAGTYQIGGANRFDTQVMWFKREHRLALAGLAGTLLEQVQGVTWYGVGKLVREPGNEADPNAVVVEIGGKPVGYLPADEAARLASWIDDRNRDGLSVSCPVRFTFEMGNADLRVDVH